MLSRLRIFLKDANRLRLTTLVLVIALSGVLEVLAVASIMPFMAFLSDPNIALNNALASRLLKALGATDPAAIIGVAGAASLLLLVLSNGFAILSNWLILRFVHLHGHLVSSRLLSTYMHQPYSFFLDRSASELQKNVVSEVKRVTAAVLLPLLQLVSKLIVLILMIGVLFAVQPVVSISSALVIGSIYALIFWLVRRRLSAAGRSIAVAEQGRFKAASEALSGIKEIKVSNTWENFQGRYEAESQRQANSYITAEVLSIVPKNILELIAFGGIIIIAMYLVYTSGGQADVLPVIALYAFAGYRLLPAVQQIYSSLAVIRFNSSALDIVTDDLRFSGPAPQPQAVAPLPFGSTIALEDVRFGYGADAVAINGVSLEIRRNSTVGFVGKSGAGKSTIIDIILGLLVPASGQLKVDNAPLRPDQISSWQAVLGYVPQQIYLTDGTIASNIAFGVPDNEIDHTRLTEAISLANLTDYVATLPNGLDTLVGERGVRLSGGQRQRIGIARALYRQPSVLILDEATSALDNLTERSIVEAIDRMAGKITIIIIAHRLTSLKHSDCIFFMQDGQVTAQGSYDQLYDQHAPFRSMVHGGSELLDESAP